VDDAELPRWETGRVEAFSDGVFAIAITLLVLEISVDPGDFGHLARALADQWPSYVAYVTSFLTVGSIWIAHHTLFAQLRYVDPVLLRINLMLLMVTAFLPFPTGVVAEAFHSTDRAERIAIGVYGITVLLLQIAVRGTVRYAARHPQLLTDPSAIQRPPEHSRGPDNFAQIAYAAAIVFGVFAFPQVAAGLYLFVAARGALVVGEAGRFSLRRVFRPQQR
jgi:uncharacterized membrane protein